MPDPNDLERSTALLPAAQIKREAQLRTAMLQPALDALARPGAVQRYSSESDHVTIAALTEIAAHMGVSVTVTPPTRDESPAGRPCAIVQATVTRADGVSATATGVCESGEGRRGKKYLEWHACCAMAETRARSRALSALLAPIIAHADPSISATPIETMPDSSATPIETMPDSAEPAGPSIADQKLRVLEACHGDKQVAAEWWREHSGNVELILAEIAEQRMRR